MKERKYSITEIDAMRADVYALECGYRWEAHIFNGQRQEMPTTKGIEERLRTYLIAGISPEELGKHAAKHVAECRRLDDEQWERQEAFRREALLAQEYGPRR